MDQNLCFALLCISILGLTILWVWQLKRQKAKRASSRIDRRVEEQLAYERRMEEERRKRDEG